MSSPGRRDGAGACRQRGSASLQLVLATPALLLVIMLAVQLALWQHATHVATAAAQHGVAAGQVEHGSPATAAQATRALLDRSGRGIVLDPEVEVTRDAERTRVVVRGHAVSVVPGFRRSVTGVADGPTERFRSRLEP